MRIQLINLKKKESPCIFFMMNATAPDGAPPRRISNLKISANLVVPPCPGEALGRVTLMRERKLPE
jgi:hypothetical protein